MHLLYNPIKEMYSLYIAKFIMNLKVLKCFITFHSKGIHIQTSTLQYYRYY